MYVKFSSTYEEVNRYGDRRTFTNSFEAIGNASDIKQVMLPLLKNNRLPGTTPFESLNFINNNLLTYDKDNDDE